VQASTLSFNVGLSKIAEVSERARVLAPKFEKSTGKPFIYFQRGEVGVATPPFLSECFKKAIEKGCTKYPRLGGEVAYLDAVLADLAASGITGLRREHVMACHGGQEGLELVFSLFRGKRCAGFTPAWSCLFDNIFPYADIDFVSVPLQADAEKGWAFSPAELSRTLAAERVDVFYLNSPHNPTGTVFSPEEVRQIAEICASHGVTLVCDEAYRDLVYVGEHFSPLALESDHIVSINTFSKTMAATGFRIGYVACRNPQLIQELMLGNYTQTAGVSSPTQHAFAEALRHPDLPAWKKAYHADMRQRAETLTRNLDPRLGAVSPQGAFYSFINVGLESAEAEAAAVERLLEKGIAVVPGSAFGREFMGYVRLSFSTLRETLAEGAKRFSDAVVN
jgi:aspartate aminotransferase